MEQQLTPHSSCACQRHMRVLSQRPSHDNARTSDVKFAIALGIIVIVTLLSMYIRHKIVNR
ncbi:hypothetical protein [Streptomyces sp. 7-21]|jgi:hypothetical protein|uniref:hypothetical protein n=1 Tax=Streptomyces sp. 7-21 TaxID=2802283 RepID=UPI00191F9D5E|nr:hypothetical protein [Streptomyces sp. 7-21]MBL1068941.1 hypothetical protein [Streptomyces sp. 7-21]